MDKTFSQMTSDELCEYAISYDFQTYRDINPKKLEWRYIENYSLEKINIPSMKDKESWISWINEEQKLFKEEMLYDRYKDVEDYWIPNPYEEPVIMIRHIDGINDISDGWHRTGLAFRNNLKNIPIILGIEKKLK